MKKKQPIFQRKALCQAIVLAGAMTASGAYGLSGPVVISTDVVGTQIAYDSLTVTTTGSIEADSAPAIVADSGTYGFSIINSGSIFGSASASGPSSAFSAGILASGLSGAIINNGTIDVIAHHSESGSAAALGILALGTLEGGSITNNGSINASADTLAAGIIGLYSSGVITNGVDGVINVTAGQAAIGMGISGSESSGTLSGTMLNDGLISVSQTDSGSSAFAAGMAARTVVGKIINEGTINVYGNASESGTVAGISAYQVVENGSITNNGQINVNGVGIAVGTSESESANGGLFSSASVVNSDTINASGSESNSAAGIFVAKVADASKVINNGTINASGGFWAEGIVVGDVNGQVINGVDGVINVGGMIGGSGIYAGGVNGGGSIVNEGQINIEGTGGESGWGTGIDVDYVYGGSVVNKGTIDINGNGTGIYVSSSVASSGLVSNEGLIDISGSGTGIHGYSAYDNASIVNNGTINVGTGTGIYMSSDIYDGAIVSNKGEINVNDGIGMYVDTIYSSGQVLNSGTINIGSGTGINAYAVGYYEGDEDRLTNSGTINVDSGTGIYAGYLYEDGKIINDGTIDIGSGYGIGVYSATGSGELINSGNITVDSGSGMYISYMYSGAAIINHGTINVGSGGNGIYGYSYSSPSSAEIINNGIINVNGSDATGIYAYGDIAVTNSGTITATGGADGVDVDSNLDNLAGGWIEGSYNYIGGDLNNAGTLIGDLDVVGNAYNSGIMTINYDGGKGGDIGGDFTQTSAGLLEFEVIDADNYAFLEVVGTATVEGTIGLIVNDDDVLIEGDVITDLLTAGTLESDDTFASIDNSLLWNFDVFKDGNTIDATVVRGILLEEIANSSEDTAFAEGVAALLDTWNDDMGGLTEEQIAIIGALNSEGDEEKLAQFLVQTTPTLAGQSPQALMSVATAIANVINNRVSATNAMKRGANSGDMNFDSRAFWVRPFYNDTEQKKRAGLNSYDAKASGLVFGIDGAINEDWRLGAAFAYGSSNIDGTGTTTGQSLDSDTYQLSIYGNWTLEQSNFANFQLAMGQARNETQRLVALTSTANKGKYNSYFVQASAGYGQSFALNDNMSVTPSSSAVYTYINDKGYTETGSSALNVAGRHSDSFELGVDAELAYNFAMGQYPAAFTAHAGIAYDTLADTSETSASFVAGGGSFITTGAKNDASTIRGGIGLQVFSDSAWDLSINYDVESRKSFTGQTASVKVNYPF